MYIISFWTIYYKASLFVEEFWGHLSLSQILMLYTHKYWLIKAPFQRKSQFCSMFHITSRLIIIHFFEVRRFVYTTHSSESVHWIAFKMPAFVHGTNTLYSGKSFQIWSFSRKIAFSMGFYGLLLKTRINVLRILYN